MSKDQYPKEYKDELNRLAYVIDNEFERTVFVYYNKTNKIKIKYKYFHKDVYFDVFSRTGELIFSNLNTNMNGGRIMNDHYEMKFIIHPIKLQIINNLK